MAKTIESLEAFYRFKFNEHFEHLKREQQVFNIFRIEDRIASGEAAPEFIRRDFFKIMLFRGEGVFYFRDQRVPVSGDTLLFFIRICPIPTIRCMPVPAAISAFLKKCF